jgi:hypothetical protein
LVFGNEDTIWRVLKVTSGNLHAWANTNSFINDNILTAQSA